MTCTVSVTNNLIPATSSTPPVTTPPVNTPPVKTPPVKTPPVKTPPVKTPPVGRENAARQDAARQDAAGEDAAGEDAAGNNAAGERPHHPAGRPDRRQPAPGRPRPRTECAAAGLRPELPRCWPPDDGRSIGSLTRARLVLGAAATIAVISIATALLAGSSLEHSSRGQAQHRFGVTGVLGSRSTDASSPPEPSTASTPHERLAHRSYRGAFSLIVHTGRSEIHAVVAPLSATIRSDGTAEPIDPPHGSARQWDTAAWIEQSAYPERPARRAELHLRARLPLPPLPVHSTRRLPRR